MSKEQTTDVLQRLEALGLERTSSNQLGHAMFAWLEANAEPNPYNNATAVAQLFTVARRGQKPVGDLTYRRMVPFLEALEEEDNPEEMIASLASMNGDGPATLDLGEASDEVREILAPLIAIYQDKRAAVQAMRAEIHTAERELTRLRGILRAGGLVETVSPKLAPATKKRGHKISEQKALEIFELAKTLDQPAIENVPGSFTVSQLVAAYDLNTSTVRYAIQVLREQNLIRSCGKIPGPSGHKVEVFAP